MTTYRGPGERGAFCPVSLLTPRRRVDVALPADVPVAELVPMLLELVGEPAPGARPVPWRLSGPGGGPLPPDATLAELGMPDGELLRLAPADPPPPPPVFDDPVEALADTAGAAGPPGRTIAAVAAPAAVALAAAVLPAARGAGPLTALAAAVAVAGVVAALALAGRPAPGLRVRRAAAVTAVPLAASAAVTALPGAPGAAHLVLAAVACGTAAAAGQILLRVVTPVLVAVVVGAVPVGAAALVRLRFGVDVAALAAGTAATLLAIGPLLPRAALRLAGLPPPVVPADARELVAADHGEDLLPPDELADRAELARGLLAGLTAGTAVVAAAAAPLAAASGGWAGPVFACVAAAVLVLRGRGYADPGPARTLQAGGAAAALALVALAAAAGGPGTRVLAAAGLLATAAGLTAAGLRPPAAGSPVARRAVDIVEGALLALAVPLAVGAMGLYGLVRGL